MISMKKILLLIAFLCCNLRFQAQITSSNWKAHFAYLDFVDVALSDDNIYIAALNSVFVHNVITNSNIEFTSVDGLSGENITAIHYDANQSAIIIGYENGLVEIVNEITGNVRRLVDIGSQSTISQSDIKINNFFQDGDVLYIATGFGVVEFNLNSGFFGDTFLISNSSDLVSNVLAVGIDNDTILASIAGRGVFMANKDDQNLISESSWTNIQSDVFVDMQSFSGTLIAHKRTADVYTYNNTIFSEVFTNSNSIIDFQVTDNDELTLTYATGSLVLDANFDAQLNIQHLEATDLNSNINISVYLNDEIYFSNSETGFFKTNDLNFGTINKISPDGPELKDAYAIDAYDGDLWIAYGIVSVSYNDAEPPEGIRSNGVDRLRNNEWLNIPFEDFNARSLQSVMIDRRDKNIVYFSSFREGLLKYDNGDLTLYNHNNSNIEAVENTEVPRIFTSNIDNEGNLWLINSRQKNALKQFSTESNGGVNVDFEGLIDTSNVFFDYNFKEIVFDGNDNIYLASFKNGIVVYNKRTEQIRDFADNETQNMPSIDVKALAFDKNGELWIGTISGLRKISSPASIIDSTTAVAESIIFLEDGIAQELLFEQSITDIKVDASNNKWIGTSGGGVFYVSSDGQETIYNFTTENSPLPSNAVNDIAVDDSTGAVFFATNKGLMEFNSNVITAEEDLSVIKIFPNPVRPEYENPTVTIQGLTAGANIKITDIEGNLVYEVQNETFETGGSGSVLWDTKSFNGKKVSSGVYLVLITDAEGVNTSVEKLLIVR